MNYDQPRQLADGSGWHYTTGNRRTGVHAIGYCAEHAPHATEEEARECYGRYQRDRIELRENACSWTSCGVRGCKHPARNLAESGAWRSAALCDEHFTQTDAIDALGLAGAAGDSIHS